MGYTNVALKDKIGEMYPEIEKHHISVGLDFNQQKNAYIVTFRRTGRNSRPIWKRRTRTTA